MPLRLDIKKKLSSRSERVKSVDLHPTNPWVLSALYSGCVMIWNYDTQSLVKSFEATTLPVRNAKFIARKQWIVMTSDDLKIRVFNTNTMDKMVEFDAHTDYIRHLEVHPTLPYLLSCADDMLIKCWNWDKAWACVMTYEGHAHYVMQMKFNPKDTNTFASGALDRSIKVWGLGTPTPHFSLEGHERGVNCLDYYHGGDKPYLVSGSDDKTVKIWDYQTKAIIQSLDGHTHNLTSVLYHPRLPLIVSACEDGTVRMWHATTYRAESTLNYGMERAWSLASMPSSNKLAIGYDEGTIVLQLGPDAPVVSMDASGKFVVAINNDIVTSSVKGMVAATDTADGEILTLPTRELGSVEVFPQTLTHNSNGRFIAVCGDGEYIIYTSQQLRNKSFGVGLEFAWSPTGTGDYVVRETTSSLVLYKNFKALPKSLSPRSFIPEQLFGGACVGVAGHDCIALYDWEDLQLIRKIDVRPHAVYWSDSGDWVVFCCDSGYYVLKYHRDIVATAFATQAFTEEGIEGALELVHEMNETVGTGQWIGDCFLYTTETGRLNYYVGGEIVTVSHFDKTLYYLGYLPKENRAFFMDASRNVSSFALSHVMLEYQTAVVRGDFDAANAILPQLASSEMDAVARFLESQGFKEEALALSTDPDQKFDLAVQLAKLSVAKDIMLTDIVAREAEEKETSTDATHKWKQLGDLALNDCQFELFEECADRAEDFSGLLLLHTSRADASGLEALATSSGTAGRNNISFLALLLAGKLDACVTLLCQTQRFPEAAFFCRTYCPKALPDVVTQWRAHQAATRKPNASTQLADPTAHPDMFPDYAAACAAQTCVDACPKAKDASEYPAQVVRYDTDLFELFQTEGSLQGLGLESSNGSTVDGAINPNDLSTLAAHQVAQAAAAQREEALAQAAQMEATAHAELQRVTQRQEKEQQQAQEAEAQRIEQENARALVAHAEAQAQAAQREKEAAQAQADAVAEAQRIAEVEARRKKEELAQQEAAELQRIAQYEAERAAQREEERVQKAAVEAQENAAAEVAREAQRQQEIALAQEEAEQARVQQAQEEEEAEALRHAEDLCQTLDATSLAEESSPRVIVEENSPVTSAPLSPGQDSLDFELAHDDLDMDFDDEDADWGDM